MKFYTGQHQHYCGIDLHARQMYVCILDAAVDGDRNPRHSGGEQKPGTVYAEHAPPPGFPLQTFFSLLNALRREAWSV